MSPSIWTIASASAFVPMTTTLRWKRPWVRARRKTWRTIVRSMTTVPRAKNIVQSSQTREICCAKHDADQAGTGRGGRNCVQDPAQLGGEAGDRGRRVELVAREDTEPDGQGDDGDDQDRAECFRFVEQGVADQCGQQHRGGDRHRIGAGDREFRYP